MKFDILKTITLHLFPITFEKFCHRMRSNMILYEVNIQIKPEVYTLFFEWLEKHIQEMLALPGFEKADLFVHEQNTVEKHLVVHYFLKDQQAMDYYLQELAPKMRADGVEKFETSFQINRRILRYLQ